MVQPVVMIPNVRNVYANLTHSVALRVGMVCVQRVRTVREASLHAKMPAAVTKIAHSATCAATVSADRRKTVSNVPVTVVRVPAVVAKPNPVSDATMPIAKVVYAHWIRSVVTLPGMALARVVPPGRLRPVMHVH